MSIIIEKQNLSELGKIVLYHRKKGNFSRAELADMAGVGQTVIYEVEKNKNESYTLRFQSRNKQEVFNTTIVIFPNLVSISLNSL